MSTKRPDDDAYEMGELRDVSGPSALGGGWRGHSTC